MSYQCVSAQQDSASTTQVDERMDFRIGGYLGGAYTRARVNFYELFNLTGNLTPFTEGDGYGGTAGFMAELPLFPWLHLDARANIIQQFNQLRTPPESIPVGVLDGSSDIGKFQRTMDANIASAGLQLFLTISPIQHLNIFLGGRANLIFHKQYYQVERLLEPSYGRFVDGLPSGLFRTRNERSGEIPIVRSLGVANLNLALMAGIGYELPMNAAQSLTIAPEIFVARGLTDVAIWYTEQDRNATWQIDNLQANLAFRWYPARAARFNAEAYQLKKLQALEKEIAQERRKIQMELRELKVSGISVKFTDIKGILADGKTEIPNPTVRVEEFRSEKSVQLLPYIFFNENSSVLPGRYKRLTATERLNFRQESLERLRPIDVYYTTLNIIGKRMESNPAAVLFLTGCNSNAAAEQGNQRLSEQRAQAVSDYLQDIWKIPAKRIIIQKRDLPEKPSVASASLSAEEAMAENRRVELSSTSPDIMAPVSLTTMQLTVNPPTVVFGINILTGPGLKQWSLDITNFEGREERVLHSAIGANTYPERYIWNVDADQRNIPMAPGSMDVRLSITDIDNREAEAPIASIPVEVRRFADKKRDRMPDKRINFYTLGFMDNDAQTEQLLQDLKSRITAQTTIALDSYSNQAKVRALTQKLGVSNTRLQFSKETQERITTLLKNDTTLPEGRFFNRSVRIEVQEAANER